VNVHDFEDKKLGKVVPYGVYDMTANAGFVSVGITSDTAEFAVQSIRCWRERMGRQRYPHAREPEVRCPCYRASGRCGTDDLALLGKRSIKLHPDFQASVTVPIDCDVATGSCLLRTHCIPDQPAALRHDTRKLGRARLAAADFARPRR
jgi:hypothetical protein